MRDPSRPRARRPRMPPRVSAAGARRPGLDLAGRGRGRGRLPQRRRSVRARAAPRDRHRGAGRHHRGCRRRGHRALRGHRGLVRRHRLGAHGRRPLRHQLPAPRLARGRARPAGSRRAGPRQRSAPAGGAPAPGPTFTSASAAPAAATTISTRWSCSRRRPFASPAANPRPPSRRRAGQDRAGSCPARHPRAGSSPDTRAIGAPGARARRAASAPAGRPPRAAGPARADPDRGPGAAIPRLLQDGCPGRRRRPPATGQPRAVLRASRSLLRGRARAERPPTLAHGRAARARRAARAGGPDIGWALACAGLLLAAACAGGSVSGGQPARRCRRAARVRSLLRALPGR